MSHGLNSSVLSVDVGTSGVRAALFDERGDQIEGAQATTKRELTGFADLDPDALVEEVAKTVDELRTRVGAFDVETTAISAFWHSLMGIDANGAPTTALLTWADTRAVQAAKELRAEFDESEIHARTGCRVHPSYWPAKLRWLKTEHRDAFDRTRQWIGFAEYLCLRLFGKTAAGVSMASATGLFDQTACEWDWGLVETLGVSRDRLPRIYADKELFVVGDGAANNIGGGCTTKDKLALMIGTSGAMRVAFSGEPPAPLPPSLWSYRASRDRIVVGGALSDGGGLVQWLLQSLNAGHDAEELQQQLAALEPDTHGLTILRSGPASAAPAGRPKLAAASSVCVNKQPPSKSFAPHSKASLIVSP
jgi:gluconokinase